MFTSTQFVSWHPGSLDIKRAMDLTMKGSMMKPKKNRIRALLATALALGALASAYAYNSYLNQFTTTYPSAATTLGTCTLCHSDLNTYVRNPYGAAFEGANHNFASIENLDSDKDGFTNIQEITALTFPGDPASHPSTPPPDTTAPTVTAFTIPATSSSLTVAISSFSATDNVAVTGYRVTESATAPAAGATGWTASAPGQLHLRIRRCEDAVRLGEGRRRQRIGRQECKHNHNSSAGT